MFILRRTCKNCPEHNRSTPCTYSCIKKPLKVLLNGENYTRQDIISLIQEKTGIRIGLSVISKNVKELEKYI